MVIDDDDSGWLAMVGGGEIKMNMQSCSYTQTQTQKQTQ